MRQAKFIFVALALLSLSKCVHLVIDRKMKIIYRKDMDFALLPDPIQTLMNEIDRHLK